MKAAGQAAERIRVRAAKILGLASPEGIRLANKQAIAPDGRTVGLAEIALDTLHHNEQEQIMGWLPTYLRRRRLLLPPNSLK